MGIYKELMIVTFADRALAFFPALLPHHFAENLESFLHGVQKELEKIIEPGVPISSQVLSYRGLVGS